jgi:hypothetical protein
MSETNISILREKFTVRETQNDRDNIIVGSNRMTLPLRNDNGLLEETFIIRGKFMHEVARMGAVMITNFHKLGPFMNRGEKFNFEEAYADLQSSFTRKYVPDDWIALYHNGKKIYSWGKSHPFLDVIEQCDVKNEDEYDFAVAMAEQVFHKAGKDIAIDHLSTIALVAHSAEDRVRCGIIERNMRQTRTFNFTAIRSKKPNSPTPIVTGGIHTAAAFLEGLNLCFKVGYINSCITKGIVKTGDAEHKEQQDALKIIRNHNLEIDTYNKTYDVRYRPDMPEFDLIIKEVERAQAK